jgi:hypothetical protein
VICLTSRGLINTVDDVYIFSLNFGGFYYLVGSKKKKKQLGYSYYCSSGSGSNPVLALAAHT